MIKAYTDGSCIGNPGPGGWAVVFDDGREIGGNELYTTNNRMELTGIFEAMKLCPNEDLIIYSDSQWAINSVTGKWNVTKNLDLIKQIKRIYNPKRMNLVWIKGHNGNIFNEKADRLAREYSNK